MRMGILNGSTVSNTAIWNGIDTWSPSSSAADLTGRVWIGRNSSYNAWPGTSPTRHVIIDGNSLAAKSGVNAMNDAVVAAGLTANDYCNVAVNGRTTPLLISNILSTAYHYYNSLIPSIYMFWEITNDLYLNAATDTAAIANLKTLCLEAKHAGCKVILGTCLPRTGTGIDQETRRISVNSWVTGSAVSGGYADAVADVGSDATIGNINTCSNTTYYSDGTHLTDAGQNLAKPYFKNALLSLL